jgi:spermidine/putrescine ABC transporter ATP-binding subunit
METKGARLRIENVTKHFDDVVAVDRVSIEIRGGEFLTLLGPSGSGKTTILNMIAGFILPTEGDIFINQMPVTYLPPFKRDIGMVFQNYALFPHMTVYDNIAFPLRRRKMDKGTIETKVNWALELVKLSGYGKRYPKQLSGGQQQRIALARSLVFNPSLLLMDEPLGALDKKLREHMQLEIKHIQKNLSITVIYVTHDQEEALTMSDRIAVMNQGRIEQIADPGILYESPLNEFVADFIGESNFIEGQYLGEELRPERVHVIQTQGGTLLRFPQKGTRSVNEKIKLVVRPEKVFFINPGEPMEGLNVADGTIEEIIYIGEVTKFKIKTSMAEDFELKRQNRLGVERCQIGDRVKIGWKIEDTTVL